MGRNAVESILGAVVLAVAALFVFFAYNTAEIRSIAGYTVNATFYKVGGLKKGSDVRINGIKVGTVSSLTLNPTTYDADVALDIVPNVKLPKDTQAAIASEGILGGLYIRLDPGHDQGFLAAGEKISKTKDFRSLEDQVGEIIFLATGSGDAPK
jgi:phospholipid/cholesterol/gamma-HCH transport system substrate-binding protein